MCMKSYPIVQLTKTMDIGLYTRKQAISSGILQIVMNRKVFCECSFSPRPYYVAQTMLSCQANAAAHTMCLTNSL